MQYDRILKIDVWELYVAKNNNKTNRWTLGLSRPMNSGDVFAVLRTMEHFCIFFSPC